jgi:hypothetical protein
MTRRILALAITAAMIVGIFSTIFSRPATETSRLKGISETLKVRWETQRTTVYHKLLSNPSPAQAALNRSAYTPEGRAALTSTVPRRSPDNWPCGMVGAFFTLIRSSRGG